MAKIITPLTVTKINNSKPKEKQYKLFDGNGLILCIYPSGNKVWRFEYKRPIDKKPDSITLGAYLHISLSEARVIRDQNRKLLSNNIDPKNRNEQVDVVMSLNTVFLEWFDRWKDSVKPKYAIQVRRALEQNILNSLGKRDITSIKPKDIVSALTPMESRGSLEYLKRTKQALGQIFTFAFERGICEYNPVTTIGKSAFKQPKKNHFDALKPEQLGSLIKCLKNSQMSELTQACILWQLSTLCRPSEATNATWDEIDLENQIWVIPKERMKASREHVVPFSSFSLSILKHIRIYTGEGAYLFTGNKPNKPINRETPRIALRKFREQGLNTTSHGLRALGRTYLENSGKWRSEVMEAALAHIEPNKVKAAYNRAEYFNEKQEMLEWWGTEISLAIDTCKVL